MSHGSRSSFISVVLFFAILFIALPVSADNVSTSQTTIVVPPTNVTTSQTTVAPTPTTNATLPPTITTSVTTVSITPTTVTPANTTVAVTEPTTIVTTANPTISIAETAATGSVNVYSSPAGASILIDGTYSGTTPRTVNGVPAGNHILRLVLSGYYDYEGSIYIVPGQTAQGYGTLQSMSQVMSAEPIRTVIVPLIVPVVTAASAPAQDPGLLGNPTVITAIIGAIAIIIGSAATIFNHVKQPPKKE
jgi:hypothetical protein